MHAEIQRNAMNQWEKNNIKFHLLNCSTTSTCLSMHLWLLDLAYCLVKYIDYTTHIIRHAQGLYQRKIIPIEKERFIYILFVFTSTRNAIEKLILQPISFRLNAYITECVIESVYLFQEINESIHQEKNCNFPMIWMDNK